MKRERAACSRDEMSPPNFLSAVELKQASYTYKQTAELFAIGEASVRQLVQSGELKRVFLSPGARNKQPRITCASIVEYVNAKMSRPKSPASA